MSSTTGVRLDSRKMSLRLFAVAAWIMLALAPLRAEPVSVDFMAAEIDLLAEVEAVSKPFQRDSVELPATQTMPARTVVLNGRGPGPLYRWAVFSLHNPTAQPREMVVAAPHQRFIGSKVLWPLPEGSRVVGLTTDEGRAVAPLPSLGADAFALTVAPGATASYALEVSATGLDRLSLWHRGAFHVVADRYAFFRGLVLGISILLGIGFICLFIVRPQAMFPAAALFGWSAIGFLVLEMGYLPTVLARLPAFAGSGQGLRALAEGLMLAGVIAMLVTFLELRRWMPRAAMGLMGGGALAVVLALYGLFDPRTAIGLIRIAFALAVGAGLGIMVVLWRRGAARAQAALLGWLVLAGWTVAAGLGALNLLDPALMQPLISAGLVLVLVTLGFTLAQLAFGLGAVSDEALEEAGRRALALAASDHAVWDWQVDQGRFHVGPEIERALGLEEGACEDAAGWLGIIHPADRVAYGAAVEAAERRGRGSFSQEFRLRRADGSYRWYELRARAMPGGADGASRLIGTLADVTALRRSEDRLLADAVRDRLTGLPNRALFLDRLEQAMSRPRPVAGAGLYVIALDLDRFKSFNDGLGEEAGDYLLQITGRRLQACIGPADTVARLPGHQFAIIWDGSRHGSAVTELTGVISASVAQPIYLPAGEVVLTASMGVAPVHLEYRGAEAVLKDAGIALYEAKRQGYGAVEFFRADMHDDRSELLQREQDLRHALERDEIEVVYQPIIRLADRKLAGFEALMRWRRGDIVLEPDSFVGLAEETGLIFELGRYVLAEATRRLGTWQRTFRPHDPLFVAVNISSVQLLNNDLVEDIQRFIEREDLQAGTLKLELTESLVVENPELARKLLVRLKQAGVALACDDFGTGHSGLESVFRLPFDTVKIDRVFLEPEDGERNWTMVGAMLRLARDLGLEVVCEGIETEEQMERLSQLGCDFGQGYLIGPPVTAQKVVQALGGHRASEPGAGLAAFWERLTGTGPVAAEDKPARIRPPSPVVAEVPEVPEVPEPGEDAAPEPVEEPVGDNGAEPVIDVRLVMRAGKSAGPAAPRVGSAPFAPRRAKQPEPALPEIRVSELKLPQIEPLDSDPAEPVDAEPPSAGAPEPAETANDEVVAREEKLPAAPAAAPPETKWAKRQRKADKAAERKARRAPGKSAPAKGAPAKNGSAKGAGAQSAPAKKAAVKSAPAKNGSAKNGSAKKATAKTAAAKRAPAASARAKGGSARRGAAKRSKPKGAQAKGTPARQR